MSMLSKYKKIIVQSGFICAVLLLGNIHYTYGEQYLEATIVKVEKGNSIQEGDVITVSIPVLATTTTIVNDRRPLVVGGQVYVRYDAGSQTPFSLFEINMIDP